MANLTSNQLRWQSCSIRVDASLRSPCTLSHRGESCGSRMFFIFKKFNIRCLMSTSCLINQEMRENDF